MKEPVQSPQNYAQQNFRIFWAGMHFRGNVDVILFLPDLSFPNDWKSLFMVVHRKEKALYRWRYLQKPLGFPLNMVPSTGNQSKLHASTAGDGTT